MIDQTLTFLLGELNSFLGATYPAPEPHAVLSDLALPDGTAPQGLENKVVMTLINVERETAAYSQERSALAQDGTLRQSQSLNLNLLFLMSVSYNNNYAKSLRWLSTALGFFQSKPFFNPENAPNFPRQLQRLSLELVTLGVHELQNVWAALGAKYRPSVVYKARMVSIPGGWVTERLPTVTGTDTEM